MKRTKIICDLCGKYISKSNYTKHIKAHNKHPEKFNKKVYHLDHDDLYCKFCKKECKNKNSLAQHEIRCIKNPMRINIYIDGFNRSGTFKSWNKGLTKETDKRIENSCKTYRENFNAGKFKGPFTGKTHSKYHKMMQRENALSRGLGGFHFRKGIFYNGIKLDSSYEVMVAESLDKNNIKWVRPKRFPYHDLENKLHYYTPDFYLPDYNIYLDPKNDYLINNINPILGYKDTDKIEWVIKENNIKVVILDKYHLSWENILTLIL